MTKAARLRQARINAGYSSARAAASALGLSADTYWHHEAGRRNFDAADYAEAFRADPDWIETGLSRAERQILALLRAPGTDLALTIISRAGSWTVTSAGRTATGATFDAAWRRACT